MNILIAAIDSQRGLAKDGAMPWNIPQDEAYFTDQTKSRGGNVLTGGTTFREAYKNTPLADRTNYILTREATPIAGVELVHDLEAFLRDFDQDLWIAGGGKVFEQVISMGKADELYLTEIDGDYDCDTFFPEFNELFKLAEEGEICRQNGFSFRYNRYTLR